VTEPQRTTAADLVRQRAADDHRGILFESREWSWRQVVAECQIRSGLLTELRRDGPFHLGVLLENIPEYIFLLGGAALAGAVVVGINPTRRGVELAADITRTDCQLVITDSTQRHLLDHLDLGLDPDRTLVVDTEEYQRRLDDVVVPTAPGSGPSADDLYLLLFTSGSTGGPKAVRMTQGRAARAAGAMGFTHDDVLYSAMPLFHGNALSAAVFPAFASGATLALRRRFSASGFLLDVRQTGATFFNTVGRAISHIVATPPTEQDKDHHLRFVLGPETSGPDKEAFTRRFGVPLFEGYGSSENAIVLRPVPDARPGALGRASKGDDIAVVDPATGVERPPATFDETGRLTNAEESIGELVGRRSLGNFEGYYNNPEAEAERTRNGWYWSGDLAYRDEAGIFYFGGRTGDWLRVDSENFAAAPVERILGRFPGVSGVAVYPVPDARTGDQVMAALEIDHGGRFDTVAFATFLAAQPDLGTKWAPRYLRIVGALPVTATDKVDKKPLRSELWNTPDPVWPRVGRDGAYVPMTENDVRALDDEFAATGRAHLLGSGARSPTRGQP
jgi:fatty-acyl-CoA synthase